MNRRTGIGQHVKRLLEAAVALDKKNSYTIFSFRFYISRRPLVLPIKPQSNLSYHFIRWLPAVVYYQLFKRFVVPPIDLVMGKRADIVLFPNFVSWPVARRKSVVIPIIYDLSFVYFGQYSSPQNKEYMLKYVPRTIAHADHIITISQNSKHEIVEHYGVDPAMISIVTPAIDHKEYYPRTDKEIEKIRQKYSLPKQYFLFTSTLEPRKNVQGLLDAYAALPPKVRDEYGLVLAGMKGWVDQEIQTRLDKYQDLNIMRTGYVDDEDLPAMYSGATLFVFPTFYEGFGMPPLEAMACGVPVITSNNSSLPEVVGDAGLLIDNPTPEAICKAIQKLTSDPTLQKNLRAKGLKQAATFSWEKSAAGLLTVFEETASRKRGH
jgi:glycosyltransferase involved in cell wall biosynthesis